MHDDFKTAAEDQAFEDAKLAQIARDAAILISGGMPHQESIKIANSIFVAQEEAVGDETGVLATLKEAQSPKMPNDPQRSHEIKKIAEELLTALNAGKYNII